MRALRKISEVFLIVGEVFSFVYMATFLIMSIVFFIAGSPLCTDLIVKGIEEGRINSSVGGGTPEEMATYVQLIFVLLAITFVIWAVLTLVNALIAIKARKTPSKSLYVANIVLGLLSCVEFNLVGGILGLIAGEEIK